MTKILLSLTLFLASLLSLTAQQDSGWTPLFDGKTLTGWKALPGGSWEVVNGAIVGKSPKSESRHGILLSEDRFDDFEARAQFRVLSGDSGFYFRCEPVKGGVSVHGFQVEVDTSQETGGLYETGGRAWVVKPAPVEIPWKHYTPGEWTDLQLVAQGRNIIVHINGEKTAELKNDPGRLEGHFGLQLHGGQEMHVEFKNIAIRTLNPAESELDWHYVTDWGVEGRAWEDETRLRWFDRLPASAEAQVREAVWNLSRDSAGMMVRFESDATEIWVDYKLLDANLAMPHMPATGVSGIDLYARDESGQWRWVMVTKPNAQEIRTPIIKDLAPGYREYAAYLPLYNGVDHFKIGVPKGAAFKGLAPRKTKPIVFYGTSITHGACASRPGMVHTAILGRRLDWPVINLGFSGNGRMEPEVAEFLIRIDAAVYVIDCNPNLRPAQVRERTMPLVKQLRGARPDTPILLVEDRRNTNSWILPARDEHHDGNHAALREAYETLKAEGYEKLYYLPGDNLLGSDGEGATDASHPNDLGFMRQADAFEPVLREALGN